MSEKRQIRHQDNRGTALAQVQEILRTENPDLRLHLIGQAHYGEEGLAFVEVHGVEEKIRRRQIREKANQYLETRDVQVNLIHGKDIFFIYPETHRDLEDVDQIKTKNSTLDRFSPEDF
jgi:hypothetical protein